MKVVLTGLIVILAVTVVAAGDMVVVTNRGDTRVTILKSMGTGTLDYVNAQVTVGTFPWDAVCIDGLGEIWVTVRGTDSIQILDKFTLAVKATIDSATVPQLAQPQGITRTADGNFVFVSARNGTGGNTAAVFKFEVMTRSLFNIYDSGDTTAGDTDVAIRDPFSALGDERLYLSINAATGRIYGWNVTNGVPMGNVPVNQCRQLEVSGDGSRLYATMLSGGNPPQLLIVDASSDTMTPSTLDFNNSPATGPFPSAGVVVDPFQPQLAWATGYNGLSNFRLHRFVGNAASPEGEALLIPAGMGGSKLSYNSNEQKLYVGNDTGAGNQMMIIDATTWPAVPLGIVNTNPGAHVATFCTANPPPVIRTVFSNFGPPGGGNVIEVRGQDFAPNAQWRLQNGAVLIPFPVVQWLAPDVVLLTLPAGGGTLGILVTNPDGQASLLDRWYTYTSTVSTATITAFPGTQAEEYRMFSFPLFATTDQIRDAIIAGFGNYDISLVRAWVFSGPNGGYVELPNWAPDMIGAGRSFWLLARFGGTATVTGTRTDDASPDLVGVALDPGWNMVAAPNDASNGNTPLVNIVAGSSLATANVVGPTNNVGVNKFYRWDSATAQYLVETAALVPTEGYFVFNPSGNTAYMWFQDPSPPKPGQLPPDSQLVLMSAGDPVPPAPPGSFFTTSGGGGGGGCGRRGDATGFPFHWIALLVILGLARIASRRG